MQTPQPESDGFQRMGIVVDEARLVFGGEHLDDDHTLAQYNIRKGSTAHLVGRHQGGMSTKHAPDHLEPEPDASMAVPIMIHLQCNVQLKGKGGLIPVQLKISNHVLYFKDPYLTSKRQPATLVKIELNKATLGSTKKGRLGSLHVLRIDLLPGIDPKVLDGQNAWSQKKYVISFKSPEDKARVEDAHAAAQVHPSLPHPSTRTPHPSPLTHTYTAVCIMTSELPHENPRFSL